MSLPTYLPTWSSTGMNESLIQSQAAALSLSLSIPYPLFLTSLPIVSADYLPRYVGVYVRMHVTKQKKSKVSQQKKTQKKTSLDSVTIHPQSLHLISAQYLTNTPYPIWKMGGKKNLTYDHQGLKGSVISVRSPAEFYLVCILGGWVFFFLFAFLIIYYMRRRGGYWMGSYVTTTTLYWRVGRPLVYCYVS